MTGTGHTEAAGRQNKAYTSDLEDLKTNYVDMYVHRQIPNYLPIMRLVAEAERKFDRWLRKVKAEAWDEGQERGWMDAMESVQANTAVSRALAGVSPNPYESEEA